MTDKRSTIDWSMKEKNEYDKLSSIYDDLYAPTWPNGPNLEGLISFITTFPKGNNICEVGVGTGNVVGLLYNLGYKNFTGVDLSPKMMEIAKQKIPNLVIIEEDLRNTNYAGFDWIISVGSIYNRISNEDKKTLFLKMYNEMDEEALFFVSLRNYNYNYDFEKNKIMSGRKTKTHAVTDRFLIDYDHEWIAHDCYYGVAQYSDLKTKNKFDYTYKTYAITEEDLIDMVVNSGFKHVDTGKSEDTGYYANVWVFKK